MRLEGLSGEMPWPNLISTLLPFTWALIFDPHGFGATARRTYFLWLLNCMLIRMWQLGSASCRPFAKRTPWPHTSSSEQIEPSWGRLRGYNGDKNEHCTSHIWWARPRDHTGRIWSAAWAAFAWIVALHCIGLWKGMLWNWDGFVCGVIVASSLDESSVVLQSKLFREFCARNHEWLQPYSVFCFLRDLFGTAEHWNWGAFSTPTQKVRFLLMCLLGIFIMKSASAWA